MGYLFIHLATAEYAASVYNILFGNVLGINDMVVRIIVVAALLLLVALAIGARPLLFATLDPDVAAARGVPVRSLGLGFVVLLAVTVSEATLAVDALLVFALLLLPAAMAHQVTTRPIRALALAAMLAVACIWLGVAIPAILSASASAC